jgi:hypothetical protein
MTSKEMQVIRIVMNINVDGEKEVENDGLIV